MQPVLAQESVSFKRRCPNCDGVLRSGAVKFPGFKIVAEYTCTSCDAQFWGDVDSCFGSIAPTLYAEDKLSIIGGGEIPFWRKWSEKFHSNKVETDLEIEISINDTVTKPAILNCLDPLYGHSLIALLHAGYYLDNFPDVDLITLIPKNLEWLVPSGVSGVVLVEWPSAARFSWCGCLEQRMDEALGCYDDWAFCPTLPRPIAAEIAIERYSRVTPFSRENWPAEEDGPRIVFAWRDDRLWGDSVHEQKARINELYRGLKGIFPRLTFTVTGLSGSAVDFEEGIENQLLNSPSPEAERNWCEIYAAAEYVIGVHGSNMILPSAHAGATLELVPDGRWSIAWTASHFRGYAGDAAAVFYHRFVPVSTDFNVIVDIVQSTLAYAPKFSVLGGKPLASFY